jgi:hypothetical protein
LAHEETLQALAIAIEARIPVILWGPPGQGKSSVIRDLAEHSGRHLETVISSIREPSDFVGIPFVVDGKTTLIPPDWATRLSLVDAGLLFFDEISTAPPSTQSAMLRVVLERVAGDLYLGDNISIVGAANPPHQAADGWDLAPPMANRFCHLDWLLPADVVRLGFSTGWPKSDISSLALDSGSVTSSLEQARLVVGSFLGARPDLVTQVPISSRDSGRAFPTPRTWDMAAQVIAHCDAFEANVGTKRLLVNGLVGVGAASELLSYMENLDLPDPEDILKSPGIYDVPNRADKVYAVGASIINAVNRDNSGNRWQDAGVAFGRIAESGHSDIAVLLAKRGLEIKPTPSSKPNPESLRALAPVLRAAGLVK